MYYAAVPHLGSRPRPAARPGRARRRGGRRGPGGGPEQPESPLPAPPAGNPGEVQAAQPGDRERRASSLGASRFRIPRCRIQGRYGRCNRGKRRACCLTPRRAPVRWAWRQPSRGRLPRGGPISAAHLSRCSLWGWRRRDRSAWTWTTGGVSHRHQGLELRPTVASHARYSYRSKLVPIGYTPHPSAALPLKH